MSASSEPLDLQLQRERVARSQVEAALQSTRLQLIEMEYALRQARADASRQLAQPPQAQPPATLPEPAAKPAAMRSRTRRMPAKIADSSLGEVARAAGAIERASRQSPEPGAMACMVPGRAAQPLLSTLDLHEGDNRAIVSDFVEHLQTRLSKMQACYGSGNLTELKWHVSWITTNASRVGFEPLMAPATNLKNVLDQQQNDRIPMLLDEVIQLCERATVDSARR